jgi:hypothetical protein
VCRRSGIAAGAASIPRPVETGGDQAPRPRRAGRAGHTGRRRAAMT